MKGLQLYGNAGGADLDLAGRFYAVGESIVKVIGCRPDQLNMVVCNSLRKVNATITGGRYSLTPNEEGKRYNSYGCTASLMACLLQGRPDHGNYKDGIEVLNSWLGVDLSQWANDNRGLWGGGFGAAWYASDSAFVPSYACDTKEGYIQWVNNNINTYKVGGAHYFIIDPIHIANKLVEVSHNINKVNNKG